MSAAVPWSAPDLAGQGAVPDLPGQGAAPDIAGKGPAPLLEVRDLRIGFAAAPGRASGPALGLAVDGVSFCLRRGKVLCLVGESGCGKSVTALSLLRLLPSPPAVPLGGSILFEGLDLAKLPEAELRRLRGNRAGMVFQDPMTSLNPVMRIGEQMAEPLRLHRGLSSRQALDKAGAALERTGFSDARARLRDFPHELSGGMRQRVMIGMAMICEPDLIIADEPTTALDVTVQKQILALMRSLVDDSGSALLLITHDLGIVREVADSVAVMYAGRIVEEGPAEALLTSPAHPYTQGLLRSRPGISERRKRLEAIPGTVPGLWSRPSGCAFRPRCPENMPRCAEEPPFFPVAHAAPDPCVKTGQVVSTDCSDGQSRCRCWLSA